MKKTLISKEDSTSLSPQGSISKPRRAPRLTVTVVGRVDEKKIRVALEPLLTELVRQELAEREKEK